MSRDPELRRTESNELARIFAQDQADRRRWPGSPQAGRDISARGADRLRRVRELIAASALHRAEDYYHAAMVLQHGTAVDDFEQAHRLAARSAEMGDRRARWLAAAALDRWLMHQGKPQKYGTQYRAEGDRWTLWTVDPNTTDQERQDWDVPPLQRAIRRASKLPARHPGVRGGHVVAEARVGTVTVQFRIQRLPWLLRLRLLAASARRRRPRPLPNSERPEDGPAYLPEGLVPCTVGAVYGGCQDGRVALTWLRTEPPAGTPFVVGWSHKHGRPELTTSEVEGTQVLFGRGLPNGQTMLFATPAPQVLCNVTGCLSDDILVRVLLSLPDFKKDQAPAAR